jgi:hypothetical protein
MTLQLFKNSTDTQGKLRLNLHSLSVSELLEYRRYTFYATEAMFSKKANVSEILDDVLFSAG